MHIIQLIDDKVIGVSLKRTIFGKSKEIFLYNTLDAYKGKKVVALLSPEAGYVYQENVVKGQDSTLLELVKKYLQQLNLTEQEAIVFTTFSASAGEHKALIIIIRKQAVNQVWKKLQINDVKLAGVIPESLVLHKLLLTELAQGEKRLVLHVGKENSWVYLVDKFGPAETISTLVATGQLIPVVQDFFKTNLQLRNLCSRGVYFGEESLAFDQGIFVSQTGIKLVTGDDLVKNLVFKKGFIVRGSDVLNPFVGAVAAALLFDTKESIPLQPKDLHKVQSVKTQEFSELVVKKPRFKSLRLILIALGVALIVGGLVTGTFQLLKRGQLQVPDGTIEPSPTPIVDESVPTATPVPSPTINPATVNVRVLNGSGVRGAARKVAAILDQFTIVEVGNAERFNYQGSELHYKASVQEKVELVRKELTKEFLLATEAANLAEEDKADIEIIIGGQ